MLRAFIESLRHYTNPIDLKRRVPEPFLMIRSTSIASRLAARILKPRFLQINSRSVFPPSFQTTSRHFSSPVRLNLFEQKTTTLPKRTLIKQRIRYCSSRRAMCGTQAELQGGSIDVTRGRVLLPNNVKPLHYDLTLEPDFEKFTYEGTVVIEYVHSKVGGNLKGYSSRATSPAVHH